jgi:hypothetical protein
MRQTDNSRTRGMADSARQMDTAARKILLQHSVLPLDQRAPSRRATVTDGSGPLFHRRITNMGLKRIQTGMPTAVISMEPKT